MTNYETNKKRCYLNGGTFKNDYIRAFDVMCTVSRQILNCFCFMAHSKSRIKQRIINILICMNFKLIILFQTLKIPNYLYVACKRSKIVNFD